MGRDLQPSSAAPVAPTGVDLILGFVNTRSVLGSADGLRDADAMRAWMSETHLLAADGPISDSDVATAREIRAALAVLLLTHTGGEGPGDGAIEDAEAYLARAAALHPVAPVIGVHSSRWLPTQSGVAGFFGTLLATVGQSASTSEWKRLKACANDACHTGFLDKTKNSSALYCSSGCSSQVTSRAYRKRHTTGKPLVTAVDGES